MYSAERYFDENAMYKYIEEYAHANGLNQTTRVLPFVKKMHEGQFRKGKEHVPYVYHPLLVASHALAMGLNDDALLSGALLHDTVEDCDVTLAELPVDDETREIVRLLTKSGLSTKEYYESISMNAKASLVKLMDRCNNVSSMAMGFSKEKMREYIAETETYVVPLLGHAKAAYPEYSNALFLLEYHLMSVVESIKRLI